MRDKAPITYAPRPDLQFRLDDLYATLKEGKAFGWFYIPSWDALKPNEIFPFPRVRDIDDFARAVVEGSVFENIEHYYV